MWLKAVRTKIFGIVLPNDWTIDLKINLVIVTKDIDSE